MPQCRLVYIGIEYERPLAQGCVFARDIRTGEKVWERLTKKYRHGTPAYWRKARADLCGSADHEMVAIGAKSRKVERGVPDAPPGEVRARHRRRAYYKRLFGELPRKTFGKDTLANG